MLPEPLADPMTFSTLKKLVAGCLMLSSTMAAAWAQGTAPGEGHQFDFWLGQWDVFDPQGQPAGKSHIESIAEGVGILENWSDSSGTTGKSLNVYNAGKKCWQQFWVGNGTPVLELSGGLVGSSMVLTGTRTGHTGVTVADRITWTPNADGSVGQHWESSSDGGKTWRDNFVGIYRRAAAAQH
jgi:hypothetical protein